MSKNRDYTRYSKESAETAMPTAPVEVEVRAVEPEQESTVEEPKFEGPMAVEPEVVAPKYLTGIVTDCAKLNVRMDPHPTSTILGVVVAETELIVSEVESTNDFYKVCTPAGLEGYCMKRFVTILP